MERFRAYLDWLLRHEELDDLESDDEEFRDSSEGMGHKSDINLTVDDINDNEPTSNADLPITHHLPVKPSFQLVNVNTIVSEFHATNFLSTLTTFIRHYFPPPQQPILPNPTDLFDAYKHLSIHLQDLPSTGRIDFLQRIHAVPLTPGSRRDSPTTFDIVLVRTEGEARNQATKGTYLEGALTALLLYAVNSTFSLCRTSGSPSAHVVAGVIPIHDIVSSCYLIPKFGTKFFPAKWTHLDILDNWKHFSLNKYIDLSTFYKHQDLA